MINEEQVKKEFMDLYSPETAFGNEKLLSKIKILENIEIGKNTRKDCVFCRGTGQIEDDCPECDGSGRIERNCTHDPDIEEELN